MQSAVWERAYLKQKQWMGERGLEFLDPRPASKYLKRMASPFPFCGAHARMHVRTHAQFDCIQEVPRPLSFQGWV